MLEPGHVAPAVTVTDRDGAEMSLSDLLDRPGVVIFAKADCETTRMALPVLAGWRRYEPEVRVLLVSQETVDVTDQLLAELDVDFETWFDRPPYPASAAFDIPAVPAVFLVEEGMVIRAGAGWYRDEAEQVTVRLAEITGMEPVLVGAADLPPFRPG